MAKSPHESALVYRKWLLWLSVLSTCLLTYAYLTTIQVKGINLPEMISLPIFGLLAAWVSWGFVSCLLGFLSLRADRVADQSAGEKLTPREVGEMCRTAVLVPVYNESPVATLARIKTTIDSLVATGGADGFEFYILSDTTDPDVWLKEELAWSFLVSNLSLPVNVYYRRRILNVSRKAGNLADFCERWGKLYDYMIVFDADSVMTGDCLVEMVARMQADPRMGILQVPPRPVNRHSLLARWQQFSACFYGPVCIQGFASWAGKEGNYWGHNAIIRIRPFMQNCQLPLLPGKKPLGGEILSHDFVEAALMVRAGYHVQLATDLAGSYEECPTSLANFLQRDQRWCQGNLQHMRLIISAGFHHLSRLHFIAGVMSYLSAPLWFLFIGLTVFSLVWEKLLDANPSATVAATPGLPVWGIFAAVMSLLLLPKFFSMVIVLSQQPATEKIHRGKFLLSVIGEILLSIVMAPVIGYYHSKFVWQTLTGNIVKWNCQQREESRVSLDDAWRSHWDLFLAGVAGGLAVILLLPEMLIWSLPLLAGPLLIFPLAMALGSSTLGKSLEQRGYLLIPEERFCPLLEQLHRQEQKFQKFLEKNPNDFEALIKDSRVAAIHSMICAETMPGHAAQADEIEQVLSHARKNDWQSIPAAARKSVMADLTALQQIRHHSL